MKKTRSEAVAPPVVREARDMGGAVGAQTRSAEHRPGVGIVLCMAMMMPARVAHADATETDPSRVVVTSGAEPARATASPEVNATERSFGPAVALGAASVVGLGLGVGMTVASTNAREDAVAQREAVYQVKQCCIELTDSVGVRCDPLEDVAARADTLASMALASDAASGARAAATAIRMALPPGHTTRPESVRALPGAYASAASIFIVIVGAW